MNSTEKECSSIHDFCNGENSVILHDHSFGVSQGFCNMLSLSWVEGNASESFIPYVVLKETFHVDVSQLVMIKIVYGREMVIQRSRTDSILLDGFQFTVQSRESFGWH